MSNLTVTDEVRQQDGQEICVLHIQGHLDGHTYPEFEAKLNEEIEAGRYDIVIDFEHLDYISSAGLGALLNAHTRSREHNGDVHIAGLSQKTRRLFDLLGFSHVLSVYDSVDEAVAAFGAGARNGDASGP